MVLKAMWMKRRAKCYKKIGVCSIVAMLLVVWFVPSCFAVDAGNASDAISKAERDLSSAYATVAEAEAAGANVSLLLSKLEQRG